MPRALTLVLALVLVAQANQPQVIPGIEVLLSEQLALIGGKRVGLITNHTGVDRRLRHDIDLLAAAPGVRLTTLFSPEHGVRGAAQAGENVRSTIDVKTGVPVHSLYAETRRPTPEMLND
ncbi:MAG TPA: exo-beta-N-acetylmuramidase NamZ domain-containing protein, partial [Terriglobia bacterium]|nr:exo-beta-N-acetylmuramidase NamZ domain-containing protein [Terriglobia bacterium]